MEIDEELNIKLIVRILLKRTKRQKKHTKVERMEPIKPVNGF